MFEIGSALREARERRGLSYSQVEEGTKIRARYIRALEDEDFGVLPGATYSKGFLRAYADYLGLDGHLFIDEFNSRYHDPRSDDDRPIYPPSRRTPSRHRRETSIVLIALAAIVAIASLVFLGAGSGGTPNAPLPTPSTTTHNPKTTQSSSTSSGGSSQGTTTKSTKHKQAAAKTYKITITAATGDSCAVGAPGIGRRPGGEDDPPHRSLRLPAAAGRAGRDPGQGHRRRLAGGARQRHHHRGRTSADAAARHLQLQDHQTGHRQGVTRPTAAILLTGSELLRGVIPDRNAAYLAERLESLGFSMRRTLMVGDPLADIEQGFRELAGAHDLIVTSGGLGPTHDDRTVEALAAVAGVPLELDEAVLARITSWTDEVAQRMGFDRARFDAGNRKQARIPRGAQVLGMAGTAPGLVMAVDGSVVVVLPGVPSELRRLWQLAPEHPLLAPLIGPRAAAATADAAHVRHR